MRKKLSIILLLCFPIKIASKLRVELTDERRLAYTARSEAARTQTIARNAVVSSTLYTPDEKNKPDFAGNFSKCLEHDPQTGILTEKGQKNYRVMISAINNGLQAEFNDINLSDESIRKLVNPQNALAFSMVGCDSSCFKIAASPELSSRLAACEIIELYLQAICRNVRFEDYGTGQNTDNNGQGGSITWDAANIMNSYGATYEGPRDWQGNVTPSVLFRGTGRGPKIGQYISQFLLLPVHKVFQPLLVQNQFVPIAENREFGVSWSDFISIQNGNVPKDYNQYDFDQNNLRYPINGKDIATFVHMDAPTDAYFNALNILLFNGFPFANNLPYQDGNIKNEDAFNTMGLPDVFGIVAEASNEALKAAWCQKWRVYRRLRPEAMAGLADQAKVTNTNPYNLNETLFLAPNGVDVLQMVYNKNEQQAFLPHNSIPLDQAQTYLLGQMYPEGSPTHPSYPAGHAVVAGACTTVMKAFMQDDVLIKYLIDPVKVNPLNSQEIIPLVGDGENEMTVGSELDKLASNIALARDFAGVHYRSDGDRGILLGEEVGIRLLQDRARIYNEQGFNGFELTKRNGKRIRILPSKVIPLN